MKGKNKYYKGHSIIFIIFFLFTILSGCTGSTPVINSFFATPPTIVAGESSTLSWTVTDADSVTIDYGIGTVALTGITTVNPTTDTAYTLIATNSAGTVTATATVTVSPIETLTLQPGSEGKDAEVMSILPEGNFGDTTFLSVGIFTVPFARSYLQFDLNSIPSDAVIIDANLGLYFDNSYELTSLPVGLYRVTESWAEDTVTWDDQPAYFNEPSDIQILSKEQSNNFVYWQIIDLVEQWKAGSVDNYGIVLLDTDESSDNGGAEFFSSDWASASKWPKLVIEYYIP